MICFTFIYNNSQYFYHNIDKKTTHEKETITKDDILTPQTITDDESMHDLL